MTPNSFAGAIFQALICFASIAVIRLAIAYLGARTGAILLGMPMVMFPMLVIQAWQGPPVTPAQTAGSIASMTAVTCALWILQLPLRFSPLFAVVAMALAWCTITLVFYLTALPAEIMTAMLVGNAAFVLIRYRKHRSSVIPTKGKWIDGALPVAIFLVAFFTMMRAVPDFARGVLVSFPIG